MTPDDTPNPKVGECTRDEDLQIVRNAHHLVHGWTIDLLAWVIAESRNLKSDQPVQPIPYFTSGPIRFPIFLHFEFVWLARRDPIINRLARTGLAERLRAGAELHGAEMVLAAELLVKGFPARRTGRGDNLARDYLTCSWLTGEKMWPTVQCKQRVLPDERFLDEFADVRWVASTKASSEYLEQILAQHPRLEGQNEIILTAEMIRAIWARFDEIVKGSGDLSECW